MTDSTPTTDAIRGCWAALATPLADDGAVALGRMVRHAQGLLGSGCDGAVLFGTTGEGTSFSAAERLAAIEELLAAGVPAARIALGAGFPAVPDSVSLIRAGLGLGLTQFLVLPPYFFRDATAEGIEDAFAAIIDGVADTRLRVTLYNIPQVSGVAVPPDVAARLRARYGRVLAGVKDSTGEFAQFRAFRAACPDLAVTVGNEADIARALTEGGAGTICGMANVVPGLVRAMFGDPAAACPIREALTHMQGAFVPTLKTILAAQTGNAGWRNVRAPLRPGDAAMGERIAAALRGLGVSKAA